MKPAIAPTQRQAPAPPPVAPRRRRGVPHPRPGLTPSLLLVYATWAIIIYDPQWLAAAKLGLSVLLRLPVALFGLLLVLVATHFPLLLDRDKKWYPPFLVWVLIFVVTVPMAYNRGYAFDTVQQFFLYYILAVATLLVVRTPAQAVPIVLLYLLQYVWWGVYAPAGRAGWHPSNANFDGFGPQMVIGMGVCFYYGVAAQGRWLKRLAFALAGICIVGIVASFARGAVLSAAAVGFVVWLRAPRKGMTALAGIAGLVILLLGARFLFPTGTFWHEIQSAFTEGTDQGTGADRWALWTAAWEVFKQHPLFGVGGSNFGPFAASFFEVGDVGGNYGVNPLRLYDRSLHSIYLQILSEGGLVGILTFAWLVVGFRKRNLAMRTRPFVERWARGTSGQFNLAGLALALELGMIAYLVTGVFYAQLRVHWFFTLLALNAMLYVVTKPARRPPGRLRAAPQRMQAAS